MANEKIISQSVFEEAIKDVLTELVNSTYQWESYSDEEVGQLVELDPTQVAELSAVINDSVSAKNKVYSSQYTKELIQQSVIESNRYADDLVANLSNIKLDIVDALPDSSTVDKSTIYILKDSSGGTNNSLNVWSDSTSAFVEVGKLNVSMDNYYTKSEVDTELAKKANADEVLKPDAIVSDLTTTSGTTTLSTAGLQTELDKKVDKTNIVTALDDTVTDAQVASALLTKTELDNKADKSYVDDNFVTMNKVGTITTVTLPDYTSKNVSGTFADEVIGTISLQAGKYIIVSQAIMSNFSDFNVVGVIGLCMENYQFRCAPAVNRDNTIQLNCIMNLTEAKQLSLRYIGHHKCEIYNVMINVMKIG